MEKKRPSSAPIQRPISDSQPPVTLQAPSIIAALHPAGQQHHILANKKPTVKEDNRRHSLSSSADMDQTKLLKQHNSKLLHQQKELTIKAESLDTQLNETKSQLAQSKQALQREILSKQKWQQQCTKQQQQLEVLLRFILQKERDELISDELYQRVIEIRNKVELSTQAAQNKRRLSGGKETIARNFNEYHHTLGGKHANATTMNWQTQLRQDKKPSKEDTSLETKMNTLLSKALKKQAQLAQVDAYSIKSEFSRPQSPQQSVPDSITSSVASLDPFLASNEEQLLDFNEELENRVSKQEPVLLTRDVHFPQEPQLQTVPNTKMAREQEVKNAFQKKLMEERKKYGLN